MQVKAKDNSKNDFDEDIILNYIESHEYKGKDYPFKFDDVNLSHACHIMRSFSGSCASVFCTNTQYDHREYLCALDVLREFSEKGVNRFIDLIEVIVNKNYKNDETTLLYFFKETNKLVKNVPLSNLSLAPLALLSAADPNNNYQGEFILQGYNKSISKDIDRYKDNSVSDCFLLPSFVEGNERIINSYRAYYNLAIIKNYKSNPEDVKSYSFSGLNNEFYTTIIRRYINNSYKTATYTTKRIRSKEEEIEKILKFTVNGTVIENNTLTNVEDLECSINLSRIDEGVINREGNRIGFSNKRSDLRSPVRYRY